MKKVLMLSLMFLMLVFLTACGSSSDKHAEDIVEKYMGTAALRVRNQVGGDDFCFFKSEFDSVLSRLATDHEDVYEVRVFYFLEFEKVDNFGYALISLNFTYPAGHVDPKPSASSWKIDVFYDAEAFEASKLEAIASLDTFQSQSEALAQALEDDGSYVLFNLTRGAGEYDMHQVYEHVNNTLANQ